MLTYTAHDLCSLYHSEPPRRDDVRKAIFSAHLWRPRAARRSADRPNVNKKSAVGDRRLRVGWLNVRSLNNKTVAVRETIESNNLDVLAPQGCARELSGRDRDETETETFQLPRPWPRRMVKTIKNHKIN